MNKADYIHALLPKIIELHERPNFVKLSTFINPKVFEAKDTWFTEARYSEVCEAIKREVGVNESIEHIGNIDREHSLITLWRARYSNYNYDVLWYVIFSTDDSKIISMSVNWEEPC